MGIYNVKGSVHPSRMCMICYRIIGVSVMRSLADLQCRVYFGLL